MSVVNLILHQLEKAADLACHRRNQNLPFEVGTANYAVVEQGVVFMQNHYKMDSNHSDYSSVVAKITYTEHPLYWSLWLRQETQGTETWIPYEYLSGSRTLKEVIEVVVMDPHNSIWFQK